jgi:hypothetical protein
MTVESNKVLELPILKHFGKNEITLNPQNWRKGEKGIATMVGLVLLGTIAWGLYSFILPIVFTWVGQVLGAIAAAVLVIGFFILLPVIIKSLKSLARTLHKLLIKYDPFGALEEQKEKMVQNRGQFKEAKAKIKAIKSNMEAESVKAEKEAKEYQEKVLLLQGRAETTKTKMTEVERTMGAAAKDSD